MKLGSQSEWVRLGIKAAGAAFSGTVIGYINQYAAGLGLSDEILTTVVGFILRSGWITRETMVKDFGEGMLLAGLSQIIAGMVPQAAGTIAVVGKQTPQTRQAMQTAASKYNVGI